jgi:hypothetical protein
MDNLQDNKEQEVDYTRNELVPAETEAEIYLDEDEEPIMQSILTNVIRAYEEHYNKLNDKQQIKYTLTISKEKLPTMDGNKDVAYLRLVRSIKDRSYVKLENDPTPEWTTLLIHQEIYVFRDMREQLNPKAPWREQLFMNATARLIGAGIEYGELLNRMKKANVAEMRKQDEMTESGLIITDKMPNKDVPLSDGDKEYAEWAKKNSEFRKM